MDTVGPFVPNGPPGPVTTLDEPIGWSYGAPIDGFASIAGWISFYPGRIACRVDDEVVRPQAGGFYGGWITDEIVGPFKGEPGTRGW